MPKNRTLPRHAQGSIALPFFDTVSKEKLEDLVNLGADIFEFRLDLANNPTGDKAKTLTENFATHPLILTCRSSNEGGKGTSDKQRLASLQSCAKYATAIDIEIASTTLHNEIHKLVEINDCELIMSYHNFETTPALDELTQKVAQAFNKGADICKIVTTTSTSKDLDVLIELLETEKNDKNRPLAVMNMTKEDGDLGATGRVQLAKSGSVFMFACLPDSATAKGQPELSWLVKQLRS